MHELNEQEIALLASCGASAEEISAIIEDCAAEGDLL